MRRLGSVEEAVLLELRRCSTVEGKYLRLFGVQLRSLERRGLARRIDVGTRGDHIAAYEITEEGARWFTK